MRSGASSQWTDKRLRTLLGRLRNFLDGYVRVWARRGALVDALNCLNDVHIVLYPTLVSAKLWVLEGDGNLLNLSGALVNVAASKYSKGELERYANAVCELHEILDAVLGVDLSRFSGLWTWDFANTLVGKLKDHMGKRKVKLESIIPRNDGKVRQRVKKCFDQVLPPGYRFSGENLYVKDPPVRHLRNIVCHSEPIAAHHLRVLEWCENRERRLTVLSREEAARETILHLDEITLPLIESLRRFFKERR